MRGPFEHENCCKNMMMMMIMIVDLFYIVQTSLFTLLRSEKK